jgi:hypothetical protein
MLKELALRRWTVEFSDAEKTNPVLLIKIGDSPHDSIQMFQIQKIHSMPRDATKPREWIEILVLDPTPEGWFTDGVSRYTTRNVEEWPNLDVEVFKHFLVDQNLYPNDIEYKTWLDKDLVCESTFNRGQSSFGQQCEVVRPRPLMESVEKVFVETFHPDAISDDIAAWINTWLRAEQVISIVPIGIGFSVFYRATEPVK